MAYGPSAARSVFIIRHDRFISALLFFSTCLENQSQIFSRPARPNSVNKHFIIWPSAFSFNLLSSIFFFLGKGSVCLGSGSIPDYGS